MRKLFRLTLFVLFTSTILLSFGGSKHVIDPIKRTGGTPPPTFIEKDTIVTVAPGVTWKMTFRCPDFLYSKVGVDSGTAYIEYLGASESAANSYGDASMTKYGLLDYVHAGWDGGITLGDGIERFPIIIHISQQPAVPANVIARVAESIRQCLARFRIKTFVRNGIKKRSIHLTGLSAGGATAKEGLMADTVFARNVASVLDVEGQKPDDLSPYPGLLAGVARAGVRIWFIEGGNDGRDQGTQANTMNAAVANSALRTVTTSTDPMYGHSNWQWVYGGNGAGTTVFAPHVFNGIDGRALDGPTWQYIQGDTVISTSSNNPIASAGPDQTIYYTVGVDALDASGSVDPNGPIASYTWSKISGPSVPAVSFSNVNGMTTNVSNLTQGIYTFRVTVTDSDGNSAFDDVIVTVQAPPNVDAGPDQNISTSSSVFAAVSSDEGSVVKNIISKMKAPGQAVRRIGVIGSSTGFGYGVSPDSVGTVIIKNFYKSFGIIDTLINLSVVSTSLFNGLATNTPVNVGRPLPDTSKNLNALKRRGVTDVIGMFTTNGLDDPTLNWTEFKDLNTKMRDSAVAMGMTYHFLTTKTRMGFSPTEEQKLKDFADSLKKYFPNEIIDVWYGFTDGNTTNDRPEFSKGDGVHWNGLGQLQMANTVIAKNIFRNVVTSPAVITNPNSLTSTVTGLTSGAPHVFLVASRDNDSLWNYDVMQITTTVSSGGSSSCRSGAPNVYTLSTTAAREIYMPFGGQYNGHLGNDTLKIPTGTYDLISLGAINGGSGCKVVITNVGGPVYVKSFRLGEKVISPVNHVKLVGTGAYGFKIGGDTAINALAAGFFNDLEITNVEVSICSIGMYLKPFPDQTDPATTYPSWSSDILYVHHNYIHNTYGEGMYIGDTYPNSDPYSGGITPARLNNVEIAYNRVDSTKWDGIQLSNARTNAKIHDNNITHFGLANLDAQRAGIILGGNTNGDVYSDTVRFGNGNAIQVFGYGFITVHDNVMEATGYTSSVGEQSIFGTDFISTVETNPLQRDSVYNNTVIHPKTALGVFRFNADNNLTSRVAYYNNQFCFTSTPPGGWETTYLMSAATVTTRSGNVEFSCSTNQSPIANAGSDMIISLPTNTATLNGSGSIDIDGTITTYAWNKISGPSGGVPVSASSASTPINSLVAGSYIYTLTVTDNLGATNSDTVIVTVVAGYTPIFKSTLSIHK